MTLETKLLWIYRVLVIALLASMLATELRQVKLLRWISNSASVIEDHTDPNPPWQ